MYLSALAKERLWFFSAKKLNPVTSWIVTFFKWILHVQTSQNKVIHWNYLRLQVAECSVLSTINGHIKNLPYRGQKSSHVFWQVKGFHFFQQRTRVLYRQIILCTWRPLHDTITHQVLCHFASGNWSFTSFVFLFDIYPVRSSCSRHESGVQVEFPWPIFFPCTSWSACKVHPHSFSCWKCLKKFQSNVTEYLHPKDIRTRYSTSCSLL